MTKRALHVALALLACLALGAQQGWTAKSTIYVPKDEATIQGAIDKAVDGQEVLVAPGTYYETVDFKGKAITVRSSDGPGVTTIDGGGVRRGVIFQTYELETSVLQGFTVTNGKGVSIPIAGTNGGGILVWGHWREDPQNPYTSARPTIRDCRIVNNENVGVYCYKGASPLLEDCDISDNTGGAVYSFIASHPHLQRCRVERNKTLGSGGAMWAYGSCVPAATDTLFADNEAAYNGGALVSYWYGWFYTNRCVFRGNSAGLNGGAIYADYRGNINLTNTLFAENHADGNGGAIALRYPTSSYDIYMSMVSCTVAGNTADLEGGGIWARSSEANREYVRYRIDYSIVHQNSPQSVFDVPFYEALTGTAPYMRRWINWKVHYSDIEGGHPVPVNNDPPPGASSGATYPAVKGVVDVDPLFVGGGDYRLTAASPCVDAIPEGSSEDLQGYMRPLGDDYDMGCYEYGTPPEPPGPETPEEAIELLCDEIEALELDSGIATSLKAKLLSALNVLDDSSSGNDVAARNIMRAFLNEVDAQREKALTDEEANELILLAQQVISLMIE